MVTCSACPFAASGVFCGLTGEPLRRFEAAARMEQVPKGTLLFRQSQPIREVHIACEGRVDVSITDARGRSVVLFLPAPGAILDLGGVLARTEHTASACTLAAVHVRSLAKRAFQDMLSTDANLSLRAACELAESMCQAQARLAGRAVGSRPRDRMLDLLAELAATYGRETAAGTTLDVELDREHLGQLIGTSRETASRVLADLGREGVVRVTGREIIVLAPAALPPRRPG